MALAFSLDVASPLFTKIMSLSQAQVDSVTMPSLIARMSSDTYNIHQMCGMILRLGVRAPMLLIGGTLCTLFLDPMLTLIMVLVLPLVVIALYFTSKFGIPLYDTVQTKVDKMVLSLRENMTGIRVIKALSKEDYEKKRFNVVNKELMDYELKSSIVMSTLNPIINLILNFGLILVLVVGAYRVNNDIILPGKVLAFTTFFAMILNALIALNRMITIISKAYASSKRIDYIFDLGLDLRKENYDTSKFTNLINIEFPKNKRYIPHFDEEIKDTDDMFAALGLMLACGINKEGGSLEFWKKDRPVCSHVAYITALQNASVLADLGEMSYSTFYSVFKFYKYAKTCNTTYNTAKFFDVIIFYLKKNLSTKVF